MAKEIKNISASVKERLRNIATQTGKDYQSLLRQYVQERFLFRLSISPFVNNFILKGALLFLAHDISRLRPTRDIDFLGSSIINNKNEILDIVKQILRIDFEDGLRFDTNQIESEDIVEDEEYQGVRIKCFAFLENSRERVQIDIGFGDRITAGPIEIEFPTLLDFPAPQIKVYSIESAVAEKFEAIVSLQLQTSRMKDFYDILFFASNYHFNKAVLKEAIETTFSNREADIHKRRVIFDIKFKTDTQLQKYWTAFLTRSKLTAENNFAKVVDRIASFIEPIFKEKTKNNWDKNSWTWI
jgi:predicted nucleotidyltransferase component of viral defense system